MLYPPIGRYFSISILIPNSLQDIDPDDQLINNLYPDSNNDLISKYFSLENLNRTCFGPMLNFSLININVRSFNSNKSAALECLLESFNCKPTFVVITETWNTINTVQLCRLPNYEGVHVYRDRTVTSGGVGGGVSIFFANKYNGFLIDSLSFCDDTIEISVCRIDIDSSYIIVIGIYRPHTDTIINFNSRLESVLSHNIIKDAFTVLIAGDMNINLCDISSTTTVSYLSLMQSYGFLPAITRPTRFFHDVDFSNPDNFDPNSINGSNLDHIFINKLEQFNSAILLYDIADHLSTLIFFHHPIESNTSSNEKICIKSRPYSDANLNSLKIDLIQTNWDSVLLHGANNIDLNNACIHFCEHLDSLYRKNFPLKIKYVSQKRVKNPWLDDGLKRMVNRKSASWRNYRLGLISKTDKNRIQNEVNCAIRQAKRDYYLNLYNSCTNDIRKSWRITKDLMGVKSHKPVVEKLIVGDLEYTQPSDIANQFNKYFCSVGEELDAKLPPFSTNNSHAITEQLNSFYLKSFTVNECLKLIKKLKDSKTNIDSISVNIFKKIANEIAPTLTFLVNFSYDSGIFPDIFKIARITAIHKKGLKTEPSNYRPISSLPYISKILEKSMANRLTSFFDKYNIIDGSQFGFQRKKSTTHAIEHLTDILYGNLNNKEIAVNVLIDLKKAFDTVNHCILLDKLSKYGIRGVPHNWFKSYLFNRQQYVRVGSSNSDLRSINIGIPQGSILGPTLFLVFINDLPRCSNLLKFTLFADDTTLSISNKIYDDLVTDLNIELIRIDDWVVSNRLTINTDKTELMVISNKTVYHKDDQIFLKGECLKFTDNAMFLGLKLDNTLKFNEHINYVNDKVSKLIGIFSKIRENLPMKTRKDFYNCFIFPHFSQNIIVWGGAYPTHLVPLISSQKRIIRLMAGADYLASTNVLFFQLKLLKLTDIYKYFLCIHIFKERLKGKYCTQHGLSTRNRDLAQPVYQRLTQCQQSISFMGPTIWNSLPQNIRSIQRLHIFKSNLKEYLINQYSE